jgi:hypothetical protein
MVAEELVALTRLRVVAEADPSTLVRLLGRLQNLNITPRRVNAEFSSAGRLYIDIDLCGICQPQLALIAAKARQDICVLDAHWHPR